jgi:O-antigen/teichoic acid export membrane protein
MSFKKGFFQNLLVSGGYNYASQAILFFSTVITSRLLAPETFGFVGLIAVFTGFVSIFSDSGISFVVIRSEYGQTFHRALDNVALYLGLCLCGITFLAAYPVSLFFHNKALVLPTMVMGLALVLRSPTLVRAALLSKALRFGVVGKVTLITSVLQVLLTVLMAFMGFDYWALIVPQLAGYLLQVLLYEQELKLGFRFCSLAHSKVAFRHTRKTIGNLMGFNLINYWARNLDNLLVGRLFGVAQLGIYNRAYNLLMMPLGLITGLVSTVLFPSLKQLKNEGGDVSREYFFILRMIMVVTFPISAVLILIPEYLVMILWGKQWLGVSQFLPYFGLLLFSQALLSTTGSMLVLFEKERTMLVSGWVCAGVMAAGILYGAGASVLGIAQFYSLAFILFVLPFNLFYLFIKTFRFGRRSMMFFWLPIVGISLSIWLACHLQNANWRMGGVGLLFLFILHQTKTEIKKILLSALPKRSALFLRTIPK